MVLKYCSRAGSTRRSLGRTARLFQATWVTRLAARPRPSGPPRSSSGPISPSLGSSSSARLCFTWNPSHRWRGAGPARASATGRSPRSSSSSSSSLPSPTTTRRPPTGARRETSCSATSTQMQTGASKSTSSRWCVSATTPPLPIRALDARRTFAPAHTPPDPPLRARAVHGGEHRRAVP